MRLSVALILLAFTATVLALPADFSVRFGDDGTPVVVGLRNLQCSRVLHGMIALGNDEEEVRSVLERFWEQICPIRSM